MEINLSKEMLEKMIFVVQVARDSNRKDDMLQDNCEDVLCVLEEMYNNVPCNCGKCSSCIGDE